MKKRTLSLLAVLFCVMFSGSVFATEMMPIPELKGISIGCTKEKLISVLGEAEKVKEFGGMAICKYKSKGFVFMFNDGKLDIVSILLSKVDPTPPGFQHKGATPYPGKLKNGLAGGSTKEDIIKIAGKPTSEKKILGDGVELTYEAKGPIVSYSLYGGKLISCEVGNK